MSNQKSSKSSGPPWFLITLFILSTTIALVISAAVRRSSQITEIESLCVAPFMNAPQHVMLKLRSGESVTGEMRILEDVQSTSHYDYDISFQLELPAGTIDDDIEYNRDNGVKTVNYTVLSTDGSVKSALYLFEEPVAWPLCNKLVNVIKLSTHWIQKK